MKDTSNQLSVKKFLPGLAWFFVILVLICIPGDEMPDSPGWLQRLYFDKLVHIGIFAILVYLFIKPVIQSGFSTGVKSRYFLLILTGAIAWGLATELIQHFFVPSRSFDMGDWAADAGGAVIAYAWGRSRA